MKFVIFITMRNFQVLRGTALVFTVVYNILNYFFKNLVVKTISLCGDIFIQK